MIYYYGTEISPNQIETEEGYLICKNVPIARIGEMKYRARDLGLDGNKIVKVNRYEEDVFDPAAMASFEGKDVTDGHPPENLTPETVGLYSKGHIENVRRDGDYLIADLHIKDANLINDIQNNIKREVSCGYQCVYLEDGENFKQTQIRGNHVAVVPRGRAGHNVSIKDEEVQENQETKGENIMSKFAKDVLGLFGAAAKDAKTEDLDKLVDMAHTALDADPAEEKAQEAAPAEEAKDVEVERAPKGDDLGTKLDALIAMVTELAKKNDREEEMERKLSDETDIDKIVEERTGEEAVTIPAEKMEDTTISHDAVANLLKGVREPIAKIEDKAVRAAVVDALLDGLGLKNDKMNDIVTATKDTAATSNIDRYAEVKKAYDERNPHKKGEN